jgi:hypothetical protein
MKKIGTWARGFGIAMIAVGLPSWPAAGDLQSAFRAAFGQDGAATLTLRDNYVRFTPARLVRTSFGYVLVSAGEPVAGPFRDVPGFDAYASHAASPKVAIHYLTRQGARFQAGRSFVPAVSIGSNFDGGPYVRDVARMDGFRAVYLEGGSMHQGYGCTELAIVELRPAGPVEVARLLDAIDFSGAGKSDHLNGKVVHIVPGQSFDVAYRGNRRFTDHYVKAGDRYRLHGKSGVPEC